MFTMLMMDLKLNYLKLNFHLLIVGSDLWIGGAQDRNLEG